MVAKVAGDIAAERCRVLVATLAFNIVVGLLLDLAPGSHDPELFALIALDKATRCLCLLAAVDIVKSLTARMLSLRVHSGALVDEVWVRRRLALILRLFCWGLSCFGGVLGDFTRRRAQETFEKEAVLGKLMAPLSDAELRPRVQRIAAARDIPPERVCQYLRDLHKHSLPVEDTGCRSFTVRMAQLIMQARPRPSALAVLAHCPTAPITLHRAAPHRRARARAQ